MSAQILNGRTVAKSIQQHITSQLAALTQPLTLGILLVGDHEESLEFIAIKRKLADKLGINVVFRQLPVTVTLPELQQQIQNWNQDPAITGFLIQLPLPGHLDRLTVLSAINPLKDIDGLTPANLGRLAAGEPHLVPATARGVLALLTHYHIPLVGQRAVVVGRSVLVGRPTALLLSQQHATVTMAHRQTTPLADVTKEADILVVAAGHPNLIRASDVKPGAIVVDVGMTRIGDDWAGDVNHTEVEQVAGALSPVPGGVGPLTVTCLMENLLLAYQLQQSPAGSASAG